MRSTELLIIIFVIGMFFSGYAGFYSLLLSSNGLTPQTFTGNNTTSILTNLQTMYNITEQGQNTSVSTSSGASYSAPPNLITAAYNVLMLTLQTPVFFYDLIVNMTSKMTGFPVWASSYLIAIIMVIALGAIIKSIIGRD